GGTDGSLQLPSGYRHLFAHGITTVLLLVTLMLAGWEFMNWVVVPSACEISETASPQASAPSPSTPPPAPVPAPSEAASGGAAQQPLVSSSASYSAQAEMALNTECACPDRAGLRTPQDPAVPRPGPGGGITATRSPS